MAMGEADLNKERLELALEAAGLDLWENDLITGNVTRKATKTFEELGFTEDEIVSGVQDIFDLVPTTSTPCDGPWPTTWRASRPSTGASSGCGPTGRRGRAGVAGPGSLRGGRHRSETCENRGSRGATEKPRVSPWAQEVVPHETGLSRVAADAPSAAQTPRVGSLSPEARARPGGSPPGCAGRCRSGRHCPTWRRRCRHR